MKYLPAFLTALLITGCASTEDAYKQANQLKYEAQPQVDKVMSDAGNIIRTTLKDPDSLKNLKIANSYKCYASKMEMSDNISPKYDYGYWCYEFSYQATNSYGGYVTSRYVGISHQGQLLSANKLDEMVRKFNDVNTWHSPIN